MHTIGCALFISFFTNWTFFEKIIILLVFALFYPIYHYICIRSIDGVYRHWRNMVAWFLCFFMYDTMLELQEWRKELSKQVHSTVDTFGPHLFPNFDRMRLIPGLWKDLKPKSRTSSIGSNNSYHKYLESFNIEDAFAALNDIGI